MILLRRKSKKCEGCQIETMDKNDLERHMKCLHGDEDLKEGLDNEETTSEVLEDKDDISGRVEITREDDCPLCGQMFWRKADLKQHVKTARTWSCVKCEACQTEPRDVKDMEHHEGLVHKEGRGFPCVACGQLFKSERNLDSHMWFHVGFRPNRCGACAYKLTRRRHIERHMMTVHEG